MSQPRHVLTVLAVEMLDRSAAFYARALGWRQVVDVPVYAEFEGPSGMRIGVYERTSFGRNTGEVPMSVPKGSLAPAELYFHVEDIDSAIERMSAAGARVLSERAPRAWGDEAAYFADPDGNVLVLARALTAVTRAVEEPTAP